MSRPADRSRPDRSASRPALAFRRALAALFALALAGCATQPTVDQITEGCLVARGGVDSLRAIQTKRMLGHLVSGRDSGLFVVELKRPGMIRQEIMLPGGKIISVLNAGHGWSLDTVHRQTVPETLSAGQVHNMQGGADMDGPLMDWRGKHNRVELMGTEKVRGRDAWKLKVTQANGDVRYDYIDCGTHLESKWVGVLDQGGKAVTFESYFSDYRRVGGTTHAFRIESGIAGQPLAQDLKFERIDVNVPIDSLQFTPASFPPPPPPPPAPKPVPKKHAAKKTTHKKHHR